MKKKKKLNLFTLIALVILFVLGPTFLLRKVGKTKAAWFNDSWGYRKAVNITNSSGSALTDFQVSIAVGTSANIASGKMKSNCNDIQHQKTASCEAASSDLAKVRTSSSNTNRLAKTNRFVNTQSKIPKVKGPWTEGNWTPEIKFDELNSLPGGPTAQINYCKKKIIIQ